MDASIIFGNCVMEKNTAVETHCTSCHTPYKVPEHFIGKRIACKKCGISFELVRHNGGNNHPVIGRLALKYKFIDKKQYAEALSAQKTESDNGCRVAFEDILVEKGLISSQQLSKLCRTRDFLDIRKKDKRRGAIMVEKGFCTQDQIADALADQAERFNKTLTIRRIDDILIDSDILNAAQSDLPSRSAVGSGLDNKNYEALLSLTVSDDKLSAFVTPSAEIKDGATVSGAKDYLESEGITHGIVDDGSIQAFFEQSTDPGKPFKIAEGTAPIPGKDATVQYYFDTDRLKPDRIQAAATVGNLSADEIPAVKEGDVIAEKIPLVLATTGMDVFGRQIPVIVVNDHPLRCGEGAVLSEDGLKVIAAVSGQPDVAPSGKVLVLSELNIPGDVDNNSGPIYFSGHIHVSGSIKPGATVKGGSLTADEISGAEIDVTGKVAVTNGIVDARIQAHGDIDAKYIKGTNIFTSGNVSAKKEIMNSEISASGRCAIPHGKILASVISAGNGIVAGEIGSEMANPSTLRPGVDVYAEKELMGLDTAIEGKDKTLVKLEAAKNELDRTNTDLHKKIAELAQIEDRTTLEHRSMQEKIEGLRENGRTPELAEAEIQLKKLDEKAKKAGESLSNFFGEQDAISEKTGALSEEILGVQKEIEELRNAVDAVSKKSEGQKRRSTVTVNHAVFEGTIISGIRAKKILPATYKNVLISEAKKSGPGPEDKWEFQVFTQKKEGSGSHIPQFHGA